MILIERLESAETGSRELDARIYERLGYRVRRRGQSMRHGHRYWRSWVWLNSDNPRRWEAMSDYTTSIDASLPDENIVQTRLTLSGKWEAVHARNGVTCTGTATTEALARRIAALKAREQTNDAD